MQLGRGTKGTFRKKFPALGSGAAADLLPVQILPPLQVKLKRAIIYLLRPGFYYFVLLRFHRGNFWTFFPFFRRLCNLSEGEEGLKSCLKLAPGPFISLFQLLSLPPFFLAVASSLHVFSFKRRRRWSFLLLLLPSPSSFWSFHSLFFRGE